MRGYVGPGFIGTIDALRRIVEARFPERWGENLPTPERRIWDALGVPGPLGLEADSWGNHVIIQTPKPHDPTMAHRCADYVEACVSLRDALASGDIIASYVDENGRAGEVEPQCWRAGGMEQALYLGRAWLIEGQQGAGRIIEVCRLLRLPIQQAEKLWRSMDAADAEGGADIPSMESGARPYRRTAIELPRVIAWLQERYPMGVPPGTPKSPIEAALEASGIRVSASTLTRALAAVRSVK